MDGLSLKDSHASDLTKLLLTRATPQHFPLLEMYPKSNHVTRSDVPRGMEAWHVNFPAYNPTYYEDASLASANPDSVDPADPSLLHLAFNVDEEHSHRTSFLGNYMVDDATHMPLVCIPFHGRFAYCLFFNILLCRIHAAGQASAGVDCFIAGGEFCGGLLFHFKQHLFVADHLGLVG